MKGFYHHGQNPELNSTVTRRDQTPLLILTVNRILSREALDGLCRGPKDLRVKRSAAQFTGFSPGPAHDSCVFWYKRVAQMSSKSL